MRSSFSVGNGCLAFGLALALAVCGCGDGSSPADGGVDGADGADGGDGDGGDAGSLAVISVSPDHGPLAGGTRVTVSGRGFVDGARVAFGASDGANVTFVSAYQLQADTPQAGAAGRVAVIVRNPDGASASLAEGYEYRDEVGPTVGWCILQSPATASAEPGQATEPIYGRVYSAGCSEGDQRCQAIGGQIGYGAPGSDPSQDPAAWTWTEASYNPGHTGDDNDEYQASLTVAQQGQYAYAYRFSADGGASWVYCDLDGSDNGYAPDQAGSLTVASQQVQIGWCTLQHPASTNSQPGQATEPVFGRVYAAGCTEGEARCAAIKAELGFGAAADNPSLDPDAWSWVAADYNPDHTLDDNDEYSASLVAAQAGAYAYAFRFSADDGASWVYCDLDGSDNGFQTGQEGALSVVDQGLQIGWCILQYPQSTSTAAGVATEPVYGRVYVAGCSEADQQCEAVSAELGLGPAGADAQADPGQFTWQAAFYNSGHVDDDNDEYATSLVPAADGDYVYAYRFSVDSGQSFVYCDLDGSDNGFSADQQGQLTVADRTIDWCVLQYPSSLTLAADTDSEPVYGRVFVQGCSDGASWCGGLLAEVGYGPLAADPQADPQSYQWFPATYNPGHVDDDNDEYSGRLHPMGTGSFHYAFRFSGDGGDTYRYCDLTGADAVFTADDLGTMDVQ